jgi:hypothetical protein
VLPLRGLRLHQRLQLIEPVRLLGSPQWLPSKRLFTDTTKEVRKLAKNTGQGHRDGAVRGRSQSQTPHGNWTKRNTETGRFMDGSKSPVKGVRREK